MEFMSFRDAGGLAADYNLSIQVGAQCYVRHLMTKGRSLGLLESFARQPFVAAGFRS